MAAKFRKPAVVAPVLVHVFFKSFAHLALHHHHVGPLKNQPFACGLVFGFAIGCERADIDVLDEIGALHVGRHHQPIGLGGGGERHEHHWQQRAETSHKRAP
jgi:hypothetical protein